MSPSRMSVSGREAHPNVREWSRGPPGCPGVVRRSFGSLGVVGGPPGCPGVFWKPYRMPRRGREIFPEVRSGQEFLPDDRE